MKLRNIKNFFENEFIGKRNNARDGGKHFRGKIHQFFSINFQFVEIICHVLISLLQEINLFLKIRDSKSITSRKPFFKIFPYISSFIKLKNASCNRLEKRMSDLKNYYCITSLPSRMQRICDSRSWKSAIYKLQFIFWK